VVSGSIPRFRSGSGAISPFQWFIGGRWRPAVCNRGQRQAAPPAGSSTTSSTCFLWGAWRAIWTAWIWLRRLWSSCAKLCPRSARAADVGADALRAGAARAAGR
ncbi:unnamed protein product, partial [Polarella glacialis]